MPWVSVWDVSNVVIFVTRLGSPVHFTFPGAFQQMSGRDALEPEKSQPRTDQKLGSYTLG
jgi:hypothetical protein